MAVGRTRLEGKVALVTGATGGMGVFIAGRLADEGATVIVSDIPSASLDGVVAGLPGTGDHHGTVLDVSEEEQWARVTKEIRARYGRLDVLVNNGALGSLAGVVDEDLKKYQRVVDVGQTGTWLGMKYAGMLIEETGGGSIVNLCSVLGTVGGFGSSFAYAAAKGGVRVMTKNAALHWAQKGVRVNSVHPSFIGTDQLMERHGGTQRHAAMVASTPMGRLGSGAEVAAAVAFLAGDDASFVTGSELYVDGGWTAA